MAVNPPWRLGVRGSRPKPLEDSDYDKQVERLSGLPKFPQVPTAQKELRRALRRISDSDIGFLRKLIDDIVDSAAVCPSPADLIRVAGEKRHRANQSVGKPDCPKCHGSGFVSFTRKVEIPGMKPYDGDFGAVCPCRGGK
jgi:hypothetical protein